MNELDRIPLDSEYWQRPEVGNVHELLTDLLAKDDLNSRDVDRFIGNLSQSSDEMELEYFPTIPYLLDLFEAKPARLRSSLILFSGSLFKNSAPPPDEFWDPVLDHKERIGRIFFNALCESEPESELAMACIAGMAAVFTFPDSANRLFRLLCEQEWL